VEYYSKVGLVKPIEFGFSYAARFTGFRSEVAIPGAAPMPRRQNKQAFDFG
jgi:hypothetical protein